MSEYTVEIENLFENHVLNYVKHSMKKYINMEMLKRDFVSAVNNIIGYLKTSEWKNASQEDLEEELSDLACDIPFGFDQSEAMHETDFDVQRETELFILTILHK